jgi:hypothetical protein
VAGLVVELLGIFVTLCGSLTLLARLLTAALLLTGLLTWWSIWLPGLILVCHGVSFHGNTPHNGSQFGLVPDQEKMRLLMAQLLRLTSSDARVADLCFLCRRRLRSDIGSQRPQFRYHHTNTQAPPDEQAGTCVSAQPMAAHTIDLLFNNQRNFRMSNAIQNGFPESFQALATAYGDYTKKSFEDTKSFVEKLSGVRSFDKAFEIQTEFAKSAFETFVTESQKIGAMYTDLAKQSYKPFGGFVTKAISTE